MCIYILHLSDICTLKQCICTPIGDLSKIHKSEKYKEILVVGVSQSFLSVVCLVQQADKMHHKFHPFFSFFFFFYYFTPLDMSQMTKSYMALKPQNYH